MGTLLASDIVARAARILNDITNVNWSTDEVLDWINDGQRAIVTALPQAYPLRIVFPLAVGDVLQPLPSDAFRLLKLGRNMGVNGTTPTRPITPINEMQLYNQSPNWPNTTPTPTVKHYAYDANTPYQMWVYPPPSVAVQVEAWISKMPPEVPSTDDPIVLDDSFFNPLIDYVLARCYQKNSEVQGATDLIAGYMTSFNAQLKARDAGDRSTAATTEAK